MNFRWKITITAQICSVCDSCVHLSVFLLTLLFLLVSDDGLTLLWINDMINRVCNGLFAIPMQYLYYILGISSDSPTQCQKLATAILKWQWENSLDLWGQMRGQDGSAQLTLPGLNHCHLCQHNHRQVVYCKGCQV